MTCDVFILGGFQTDFARNYAKQGLEVSDLVADVVGGTLAAAQIGPETIETIHVGNAFGQLFNGQGQLGGMPATVEPALWGIPAARHEAACASGGISILAAMAEIEAGRYDCALVVGAEQERNVPAGEASRNLGAAAWIGHEGEDATFMWPHMFSLLADEYDRRYGLDDRHLSAIAELNFRNAKSNPNAQTRAWAHTPESFTADDIANPVVDGRIRRSDCSQVTDGGAGLVLAGRRTAEAWAAARGRSVDTVPRIAGWGHRTVGLPLAAKVQRSADGPYVMPHVRQAITDAFRRAGVADVSGVDGIETHDCFTSSEYMAIDHFGITAPGESWRAVEDGTLERDGATPVNPSGGLIGGGHPVGATGVRMVVDAANQVSGTAGETQVEGARTFSTLNIGGSTTTTVSFVVAV
ncbi:MAG TPA: acetyl-CoA acetyltransferase [Ilumatobacteraceae bacterium]|nr:acetyl-CoA acetyltransferase [Ilumatobacteraceae bacterium]HRB04355.1 acetyl-CoA acetyltransferase [Ilumatobacteraceae bacterium]